MHEGLAFRKLRDRDIFIGLVGVFDRAWSTDDGGYSDFLEEAGLGAIGDGFAAIRLGEVESEVFGR
jgi:hypothetical protein